MDPIAHTFTGAALASTGLRRVTPLAGAALVIGANAPDVDALSYFAGDYVSLAFRRGWTHGVPAMVVLPFAVTGLLLLWHRWMRRRRADAERVDRRALLALAALGVATHPMLDWLNNYGLRWLMPFDGRWFYGDALFIVDPWVWLGLGGVLFLAHSRRPTTLAAWALFWLLAAYLMLFAAPVPAAAAAAWTIGLAALWLARASGFAAPLRARAIERGTRAALGLLVVYAAVTLLANLPARAAVRAELASRGLGPVEAVMVGPVVANPFLGEVVAQTPDAYYLGRWRWLGGPRLQLAEQGIPRLAGDPIAAAAARTPEARRFLTWSRFPYFEIATTSNGHRVRLRDARYGGVGGGLAGPTVLLDKETLTLLRVE